MFYFHIQGPLTWFTTYPQCAGARQSPVDLDPDFAVPYRKEDMGAFTFKTPPENAPVQHFVIENNGYTGKHFIFEKIITQVNLSLSEN